MMRAALLKRMWALFFPGGATLLAIAVLFFVLRPWLGARESLLLYISCTVFTAGLLLSAIFQRSRIFFALLCFALADLGVGWLSARSSPNSQLVVDAVAILLPLNIFALARGVERGIVTAWGKWEMLILLLQAAAVGLICFAAPAQAANLLGHRWIASGFADWSRISQLPLLIFIVCMAMLMARLLRRRSPVESGMFWALAAGFLGIQAVSQPSAGMVGFAASAAILTIAVLENSYRMAFLDELTGLPGRRSFNEALLKLEENYAIAMVDVDHFKQFNDTFGHAAGDQVLQMVAGKLAGVGSGGNAFRYGGEEFAVVFSELAINDAFAALEELRQRIEQVQFRVRGKDRRLRAVKNKRLKPRAPERRRPWSRRQKKPVPPTGPTNVTVSIGVAAANSEDVEGHGPEAVVRAADKALYRAKQQGRNRVLPGTG